MEAALEALTTRMKERIGGVVDVVERKVADALSQEIRLLSTLVEDFNEQVGPVFLGMCLRILFGCYSCECVAEPP